MSRGYSDVVRKASYNKKTQSDISLFGYEKGRQIYICADHSLIYSNNNNNNNKQKDAFLPLNMDTNYEYLVTISLACKYR